MEDQVWSYGLLTSSSKFNNASNKFTSDDFYDDYEEVDVEDELEPEYICPFCSEDFDIVGLCCHIEDMHPVEAKKGVCPICGVVVGMNLIDHVALEHDYVHRRGGHGGSESLSMLQKEFDDSDRSLESLLMRPPSMGFSPNVAADRLLTSFIGNYLTPADVQSETSSSKDICEEEKPSNENILEREAMVPLIHIVHPFGQEAMENLSVNEENKEETARRSKFVQSLLFSTILDDDL